MVTTITIIKKSCFEEPRHAVHLAVELMRLQGVPWHLSGPRGGHTTAPREEDALQRRAILPAPGHRSSERKYTSYIIIYIVYNIYMFQRRTPPPRSWSGHGTPHPPCGPVVVVDGSFGYVTYDL